MLFILKLCCRDKTNSISLARSSANEVKSLSDAAKEHAKKLKDGPEYNKIRVYCDSIEENTRQVLMLAKTVLTSTESK